MGSSLLFEEMKGIETKIACFRSTRVARPCSLFVKDPKHVKGILQGIGEKEIGLEFCLACGYDKPDIACGVGWYGIPKDCSGIGPHERAWRGLLPLKRQHSQRLLFYRQEVCGG